MLFNKKNLIILLIFVAALAIIGGVYAQEMSDSTVVKSSSVAKVSAKSVKTVTVKIYNFKPGEMWGSKAVKLKNGDAIAGYVAYKDNLQNKKGTGVTAWYLGNGNNGDINPHHIKLVKAKFYFKNKAGKVKTKTVKGNSGHLSTGLIKNYTPYKAVVSYTSK